MKDETIVELQHKMIEDKLEVTNTLSFLLHLLVLLCLITFLSGCGAVEKMCPRDQIHAGCNTLVGKEKLNVSNMEKFIELLEMKIELLELHLSNLKTRDADLEYELTSVSDDLYLFKDRLDLDLNEINNRLNNILKRLSNGKK